MPKSISIFFKYFKSESTIYKLPTLTAKAMTETEIEILSGIILFDGFSMWNKRELESKKEIGALAKDLSTKKSSPFVT